MLRSEVSLAPHLRVGGGAVFGSYRAALWLGGTSPATLTTFDAEHTVWGLDVSAQVRWQPPLRLGPVLAVGAGADVRTYLDAGDVVATTTPPFVAASVGAALTFGAFDVALLARGAYDLVPTALEKGNVRVTEGGVGVGVALEVGTRLGKKP